jgi:polysaccharide export outer membrane protein
MDWVERRANGWEKGWKMSSKVNRRLIARGFALVCASGFLSVAVCAPMLAQTEPAPGEGSAMPAWPGGTTQDYNRRIDQLGEASVASGPEVPGVPGETGVPEYRIGANDLVAVSVFDAPELNRSVRVSASGEISLPLLGTFLAAGQTPRQLEAAIADRLRAHYMRDPQVSVFVQDMQSHGVSVFGAVMKPGVYQIRGVASLVEVLSLAAGIAPDAGDLVIVVRGSEAPEPAENGASNNTSNTTTNNTANLGARNSPNGVTAVAGETIEVSLGRLLDRADPQDNILIYPGDVVKVTRAGMVYVVGEVHKPGGFVLTANQKISVLQALALAEGPTSTAARSKAVVIRTDTTTGQRSEIPIDLGKILNGKAEDPRLESSDIVFVPNSATRSGFYRGAEAILATASGLAIYRLP